MLNPNLKKIHLLEEEYTIYARHLILENIGINGQKRLKAAKVLLIGAGGLGCPAILYLAALGIGYIGIIDEDRINLSNLSRQILFNQDNNNQLKTICAKQKIQKINPQCKIITHSYKLTEYNAFEIIKYYNIIIDASDNFKTRYLINYICYQLHKIHIYGGIQQFEGQISVFNYKSGPRYSDIYPKILNLQDFNCNLNGVLGLITGTIGILQATEAIKIILGIGQIIHQDLLIYNLLYSSFKLVKIYSLKVNGLENHKYNTIYSRRLISRLQFSYLKDKYLNKIMLIDIREPVEFYIKHIKYAINIPLKNFHLKQTLNFILKYHLNIIIIIYCNQRYRVSIASHILTSNKIKHYIIKNKL